MNSSISFAVALARVHRDTAAESVVGACGMEPGRPRPGRGARWPRLQPSPANLLLVRVFLAAAARCTCLALAALTAGCIGLKQPYVEKNQYLLEAKRSEATAPASGGAGLQVRPFAAAPLTERSSFVYRQPANRYETDYYNVFLLPLNDQLAGLERQWLAAAGFSVLQPGSRIEPAYVLENTLLECLGDYRDPARPLAVLEIQTTLVDNRQTPFQGVFQKNYQRETALSHATPEELVRGWNEALAGILAELEADLRNLEAFR